MNCKADLQALPRLEALITSKFINSMYIMICTVLISLRLKIKSSLIVSTLVGLKFHSQVLIAMVLLLVLVSSFSLSIKEAMSKTVHRCWRLEPQLIDVPPFPTLGHSRSLQRAQATPLPPHSRAVGQQQDARQGIQLGTQTDMQNNLCISVIT